MRLTALWATSLCVWIMIIPSLFQQLNKLGHFSKISLIHRFSEYFSVSLQLNKQANINKE